ADGFCRILDAFLRETASRWGWHSASGLICVRFCVPCFLRLKYLTASLAPKENGTTISATSCKIHVPARSLRLHRHRRSSVRYPTRLRRGATPDRSRHRQGPARGERHLSVVSGFAHQADDSLRDPARAEGPSALARLPGHGFTECGGASAVENGLQERDQAHRRQRHQDDD